MSNVEELKQALDHVQSGQTVVLTGDNKFMLSESLRIEQHDVHLRGESPEVSTLVCPQDGSILNIA